MLPRRSPPSPLAPAVRVASRTHSVLTAVKLGLGAVLVLGTAAAFFAVRLGATSLAGVLLTLAALLLAIGSVALALRAARRHFVGDAPPSTPIGATDVVLWIAGPFACVLVIAACAPGLFGRAPEPALVGGVVLGVLGLARVGFDLWRYVTRP